ncbi:TrkA C-terminal domain-containing protein [Helicobacter sp. 13S00477-4]|uniref:COG3400 family protein n=1 Tax=Helicobacter sp. 13S00477-4 TaxID=1905759 RepID=UPI000BA5A7E1|nr:TrkA C-terminal domain-containing protein [Helicobacter sp. 13S00477-4]PAF51644.1 potassium transporter TrkA [Helicobacter sp. 13S00477-4]
MKKIVLIADGIVAKKFLDTVLEKYFSNNLYIIISKDESLIPAQIPGTFNFQIFDPTSAYRLLNTLDRDISDVFIIMEDPFERETVYEIIKSRYKDIRIVLSAYEDEIVSPKIFEDEKVVLMEEASIIAGRLVARLPNVPLIPQGFGLELGEVMEIGVPFGSVFAYRHIGSIQQKNYKIVGIYRHQEFILSTYSTVIQPTDVLLVAGEPKVLDNVYRQIKSDIGQFPAPFGRDIYVYVDIILQSEKSVMRDIEQALYFHKHTKSDKLYIRVLNPANFDLLEKIKSLAQSDVNVTLDYNRLDFIAKLKKDSEKKIGLVVIGKEIFSSRYCRKALFEIATPVLKTSWRNIKDVKESMVVLNEEMNEEENISSVIFDIAIQMDLGVALYDFDPDGYHQVQIIQDYENLSRIFDKKININRTNSKNPILFLKESKQPLLQFLPFEACITRTRFFWFLSTKVEKISFMLDNNPQIFIPIME